MKTTKINALMYFSVLFMLTFSAYAQNNSVIEEVIVTAEKEVKVFKIFHNRLQQFQIQMLNQKILKLL